MNYSSQAIANSPPANGLGSQMSEIQSILEMALDNMQRAASYLRMAEPAPSVGVGKLSAVQAPLFDQLDNLRTRALALRDLSAEVCARLG